jgi:hypothetical protein
MKPTTYLTSLVVLLTTTTLFLAFRAAEKQEAPKFEFMQFTTVESVVPGGFGRSRMITTSTDNSKIDEIKLENFYSLVGINFSNIRHNDKMITSKITDFSADGWELLHVTSGVESGVDKTGLFITRYLFKRIVRE